LCSTTTIERPLIVSDVDPFMPHIYAAVAKKEQRLIGERTKALARVKARGDEAAARTGDGNADGLLAALA